MLSFNPIERITIEEALEHPFFKKFHCKEDEIICTKVIQLPIDDNTKLSLKVYREAIYRDITCKIKKAKKKKQESELTNLPMLKETTSKGSLTKETEKGSTNHTN